MVGGNPLIQAQKIQVDHLMDAAAMQESKNLRQRQSRGDRSHEGSADRFSGKHRHPALVKSALRHQPCIGGSILDGFANRSRLLPDLGTRTRAGQRMKAHRTEVTMAAAETRLDHHVEAHLVEYAATFRVVEAAQRNPGLSILPPEVFVEPAFVDRGRKASTLRPRGHGPSLLLADEPCLREYGGAVGRGRDHVDVLQDQRYVTGLKIRQKTKPPEIGLPEMA